MRGVTCNATARQRRGRGCDITKKLPRVLWLARITGLRRRTWKPYQNGVSCGGVEAGMRKSGLRGVKVPGSDDDAVAADSGEAAA